MKKLLLTLALVAGGLFSAQAQTECADGRDNTHADRVEYIRFTSDGEKFVLLRSEGDDTLDLSDVTITHQWTYVKDGNDLKVYYPGIASAVLTLTDFSAISAFGATINSLTKVDFDTYATEAATVSGTTYSFD